MIIFIHKNPKYEADITTFTEFEQSFTMKKVRQLVGMIELGLNISHLVPIEKAGFSDTLFRLKIRKDLWIILTLEKKEANYLITCLRAFRLEYLEEIVQKIEKT
jgi:hypothetical protein